MYKIPRISWTIVKLFSKFSKKTIHGSSTHEASSRMSGRARQETVKAEAAESSSSAVVDQNLIAFTKAPETQSHLESFSLNRLPVEIRKMIWEFSFAISACSRPTERPQGIQSNSPLWGERVKTKFQIIGYGWVTPPSPVDTHTPDPTAVWLAEGPSGGLVRRPTLFTRRIPPSATACWEAYSTFVQYYRRQSKSSSELLRLNQACEQARPAAIIHELVDTGPAKDLSLLPIVPPKEMDIPLVLDLTAAMFFECDRFVIDNGTVHRDRVIHDDDPAHPLGNPRVLDLVLSTEDVYDRIKIRMNPTVSGLVRFMIPTPPWRPPHPARDSGEDSEADAELPIPPLSDTARTWLEKCQNDRTTVLVSLNETSVWKELAEIAAYYKLPWPFVEKLARSKSNRKELAKQALNPLYKTWERENKLRAKRGEVPHKGIPRLDVVVAVQVAMQNSVRYIYGRGVPQDRSFRHTLYWEPDDGF